MVYASARGGGDKHQDYKTTRLCVSLMKNVSLWQRCLGFGRYLNQMYLSDKDILVQIKSDSGQAEGQWEEK